MKQLKIRGTIRERLVARTVSVGDCHEWTGAKSTAGYGQLNVAGKRIYVHRLSYELGNGPIPDGLVIDHLCRNRACLNPAHLEVVTGRVNTQRGYFKNKTECAQGHPYDQTNTGIRANGWRYCRACARERARRTRAAAR